MNHSRKQLPSTKLSAIAADGILVFHTAFALFAVVGAPVMLIDWRFIPLHIAVATWSSLVNLADWTCPLTPLEQKLRLRAGQKSFEGGWIQHYLEPMVRPLGMPRRMELIAGYSVLVWNVIIYTLILLFWF